MSLSSTVAAFLFATASAMAQTPSFPGAEGYGSTAAGGRGGDVYVVTNLNAVGAGSFAVSGHIRLPSGSGGGLSIANSRITGGAQLATTGNFTNTGTLDLLTSASALPVNFTNTGIVIENTERRILSSSKSGADFSVTIQGYPGHSYQLQRTDTLTGAWTNIGAAIAGTGSTLTLTGNARFYRMLVTP